jgi:DNA-binding NarL/FixJ family response regulator
MAFGDIPNETSPARLLIVEDDVLVASSLDELLSASGFDVVGIAGSAATAASLAGERHPQLALIDIRLVGPIDGIELACLRRSGDERTRPSSKAPRIFAKAVPREPSFQSY